LQILQVIDAHSISSWLQFPWWSEKARLEQSQYGYAHLLPSAIMLLPSLIPLLYLLRKAVKLKKYEQFSKLFEVTPEHPAFLRINAKRILGPG
ncbi:hypothetical protein OSTOST_21862, partial [Ostertagia ostertagi]